MEKKTCINCGKEIPIDVNFCAYCGSEIVSCPECGAELLKNAEFCVKCGISVRNKKIKETPEQVTKKEEVEYTPKELLTEWTEKSSFAKFAHKVWRPICAVFNYLIPIIIIISGFVTMGTISPKIADNKLNTVFALFGMVMGIIMVQWIILKRIIEEVKQRSYADFLKEKGVNVEKLAWKSLSEITIEKYLKPRLLKLSKYGNWFSCPAYYTAQSLFLLSDRHSKDRQAGWLVATSIVSSITIPLVVMFLGYIIGSFFTDYSLISEIRDNKATFFDLFYKIVAHIPFIIYMVIFFVINCIIETVAKNKTVKPRNKWMEYIVDKYSLSFKI